MAHLNWLGQRPQLCWPALPYSEEVSDPPSTVPEAAATAGKWAWWTSLTGWWGGRWACVGQESGNGEIGCWGWHKFLGPFPIIVQINPVAFQLQLSPSMTFHPVFHHSLFIPAQDRIGTVDPAWPPPTYPGNCPGWRGIWCNCHFGLLETLTALSKSGEVVELRIRRSIMEKLWRCPCTTAGLPLLFPAPK